MLPGARSNGRLQFGAITAIFAQWPASSVTWPTWRSCRARPSVLERWPTLRFAFTGLAALAAQAGEGRDAARLLGAARLDEPGIDAASIAQVSERARNAAEQLLGEDAFDREMSSGRELSRRAAVALGRTVLERLSRLSATASGTT